MNRIKLILALLVVSITAVVGACASTPPAPSIPGGSIAGLNTPGPSSPGAIIDGARVIITRDFGQTLLAEKTVEINSKSNAMNTLQQVAQVETGYSGSFVNAIDGLRSAYSGVNSNKQDWFYYVNGLVANTGAVEYPLYNGDILQWDFHTWSFRQLIPAMIGHFPQPFLSGSRGRVFPTLVVCQDGLEKAAVDIQKCLVQLGVSQVETRPLDRLSEGEKEGRNLIVVAGPDSPLVSDLNREWKRLGFFAYFATGSLITIDSGGKIQSEYKQNTGVIEATQNPWNPNGIGADENTLWVVTGTDTAGLQSAVDCLVQKQADWQRSYAVVVRQGEVIKLP
jgi:hypothetical protein